MTIDEALAAFKAQTVVYDTGDGEKGVIGELDFDGETMVATIHDGTEFRRDVDTLDLEVWHG